MDSSEQRESSSTAVENELINSNLDEISLEKEGATPDKVELELELELEDEWIPWGKLGPFTMAEPVVPGSFTVVKCFTFHEHDRHLMKFDPEGGLKFASHNQTVSASIVFSIQPSGVIGERKGTNHRVDPNNLPEVSCMTLESPSNDDEFDAKEDHIRNNRARAKTHQHYNHNHNHNPQSSSRGRHRIRPSSAASEGALNSSQLAFLLTVFTAGVYYLYTVYLVHLVPKVAASICKSVVATTNNNKSNNNNNHSNPRRRNKGGKGSSTKPKKSSGKKIGRTKAPAISAFASEATHVGRANPETLPLIESESVSQQETTTIIEKSAQIAAGDDDNDPDSDVGLDNDDIDTMAPKESIDNTENAPAIAPAPAREEEENTILDEKKEQEPAVATTEKRRLQRKVNAVIDGNDSVVDAASSTTADNDTTKPVQNQTITPAVHKESSSSSSAIDEEEEPVDVVEKEAHKGNIFEKDTAQTMAEPSPTIATATDSTSSSTSSSSPKQKTIIVLLIEGMTCGGCVKVVNRMLNAFDEVDSVVTELQSCTSTLTCNVRRLNLLPILTALDDAGMQAYLQSQSVAVAEPNTNANTNTSTNTNTNSNTNTNTNSTVTITTAASSDDGASASPTAESCPEEKQQIRQQALGAIGRPLLASDSDIPTTSMAILPISSTNKNKPNTTNPLSLMDELRVGSTQLRRYQCSCGCEGCICSARQVHEHDHGTDVSLSELCNRLKSTLGFETTTNTLEETFRETGGSPELRDKILHLSFPCGCSDKE